MSADKGRVLTTHRECTELARAALPLLGNVLWRGKDGGVQIANWGLRRLPERGEGAEETILTPVWTPTFGGLWDTWSSSLEPQFP